MSKDEYISILQSAFEHGKPFINITQYYSYALIPQGNGKWLEVSYDLEDKEIMERNEITGTEAFYKLCEEIEKAMSEEVEDLNLFKWREFKNGLPGSEEEKLVALIEEITTNPTKYSQNLPIAFSKDDLDKIISKL